MRHGIWMVGVAILAGACAPPTPESRLIAEAAEAMGGSGRVRAVRTLVLEGEGQQANIGQNTSPEAAMTVWKGTQYKRLLDLENTRMRVQATRVPGFAFVMSEQRQDFGVDGEVAYAIAANGTATRANEQVAW